MPLYGIKSGHYVNKTGDLKIIPFPLSNFLPVSPY